MILIASAIAQYVFRFVWRTHIWGSAARLEKRYADSYLHILQGWISCFIKSIGQVI